MAKLFYVYAIQGKESKRVKIGSALSPDKRIIDLQVGSPEELAVLAARPFQTKELAAQHEKDLHGKYAAQRRGGEWFTPTPAMLAEFATWPALVRGAVKSWRQPIMVDGDLYAKFRAYSNLTGIPVARLVDKAAHEYYDVTLVPRMEKLQGYCAGDRLPVEDVPIAPSPAFTADDAMSNAAVIDAPAAAMEGLPDWAQDN